MGMGLRTVTRDVSGSSQSAPAATPLASATMASVARVPRPADGDASGSAGMWRSAAIETGADSNRMTQATAGGRLQSNTWRWNIENQSVGNASANTPRLNEPAWEWGLASAAPKVATEARYNPPMVAAAGGAPRSDESYESECRPAERVPRSPSPWPRGLGAGEYALGSCRASRAGGVDGLVPSSPSRTPRVDPEDGLADGLVGESVRRRVVRDGP